MIDRPRLHLRARSRALPWLGLALVLVPFVVSAFVLLVVVGSGYHAVGDNALNELHTRDVGHHLVLLGPWSRHKWNHLGPAMYYLLALPYRLSGSNSVGMCLGALVINAVSIAGMAIIARRRGGVALLALTLVGCSLVMRTLGPSFLGSPWNPYITVLPFGLLVFLTWEMTCGQAWALPVGAGVATFCAQTHIGYVPLALPLLVWGAAWLVVLTRRGGRAGTDGPRPADLVRALLITEAVLAVMWLPPLVAVLQNTPGNFTYVAHYFVHPEGGHSLSDGYRVVAAQFALRPEWLTGAHAPNPFTAEPDLLRSAPLPWLLLPFLAGAWVFWHRRGSGGYRLAATVALGLGLGVLSVWRTIGVIYFYRLRWTWVLAMVAALVVAWAAWTLVSDRAGPAQRRWLVALSVAALVSLAVVNTTNAARAVTPDEPLSSALAALLPSVAANLPPGHGDVIVRSGPDTSSAIYAGGFVLWLERGGVAARVEGERRAPLFGAQRVHRQGPVRAILTVAADEAFDQFSTQPGLRLIAYQGTLPSDQRVALVARIRALDTAHKAHTISDLDWYFQRPALAQRLGSAVGVFLS